MKKITFILISLIQCVFLSAQNYEQQGDELFAQSQYEKSIKKYNAAIEMTGSSSSISQKIDVAQRCQSILNQALQAEEQNDWGKAASLYASLYELHPLSTYKTKSDGYHQKSIMQQQIAKEKLKKTAEETRIRERDKMAANLIQSSKDVSISDLLSHPLAQTNVNWSTSLTKIEETLSLKGRIDHLGEAEIKVEDMQKEVSVYGISIKSMWINYFEYDHVLYVEYTFNVDMIVNEQFGYFAERLRQDLVKCGFPMPHVFNEWYQCETDQKTNYNGFKYGMMMIRCFPNPAYPDLDTRLMFRIDLK